MNTAIRHIVSYTYKPLLEKYLSRTRKYRYRDIVLDVSPEVFHPGFFFSTKLLLQYTNTLPVKGKRFLELGCGSGLIAIAAAKRGAIVTASDINPIAVSALEQNSRGNNVDMTIIQSDLFKSFPDQQFDVIVINPPYYKKQAVTAKDHAWFCGENGEYFSVLFDTLKGYRHSATQVIMALFEGCDMEMIRGFAARNGFTLTCIYRKRNLLEKNFIYKIEMAHE